MGWISTETISALTEINWDETEIEISERCRKCHTEWKHAYSLKDFFYELGITAEDCQKAFEEGGCNK